MKRLRLQQRMMRLPQRMMQLLQRRRFDQRFDDRRLRSFVRRDEVTADVVIAAAFIKGLLLPVVVLDVVALKLGGETRRRSIINKDGTGRA